MNTLAPSLAPLNPEVADAAEHLAAYAALIAERLTKHDGTPIPNGTVAHASMLVEAMFKNASNSVRILTGELNARVYGTPEMIAAARQFLVNSDHQLEVLFEGNFDDNEAVRHPLLAAVGHFSNVKLWRLKPSLRERVLSHFSLMDSDCYRFEGDKSKPSAIAAFGDAQFTKKLSDIFNNLKSFGSVSFKMPTLQNA